MAEVTGATISNYANEMDMPFEMTNEQWLDALVNDRGPENRYGDSDRQFIGESIQTADTNVNRPYVADGINELERHANSLATRETAEHVRNVENARTIGQVAGLICSYRDVELAA